MDEAIKLFNEQKYWECHEVLEDLWMEDRVDPVRNVYWAIIQVAASCIHYRDQKLVGAQGMIVKAKEKFKRCRELHVVTPLLEKKLKWRELEEIVDEIPYPSKLEDYKKLYEFRF